MPHVYIVEPYISVMKLTEYWRINQFGIICQIYLKNSLIIHEENTKKNHKRVVSVYVIQIHVDLHKL